MEFQSTLSVRRATIAHFCSKVNIIISIHALREESDPPITNRGVISTQFQSTLSVRRATTQWVYNISTVKISIHALREESDSTDWLLSTKGGISIHALREESDLYFYINFI